MTLLRRLAAVLATGLALLLAAQARAQAPAAPPPPPSAPEPAAADLPMVVSVLLNGEPMGDTFAVRREADDWLVPREDLVRWGLSSGAADGADRPDHLLEGRPHLSLKSIEGLTIRFDAQTLTLELTAQPQLLRRTDLSRIAPPPTPREAGGRSGFLNWAAEYDTGVGGTGGLSTEAGWRDGNLMLLSQGNTVRRADGQDAFVRLGSSAVLDQPSRGQRWTAGDLFAQGVTLAPGVQLGGIAVARMDAYDPYRIRYPLGAVRGQAILPSEVEVYVDGQRVRSERVRPGEFELNDLLSGQGAGAVQVVVRDPYGREQRFDYTLYTTDQLLRAGLDEYQYAAGWLRRGYGERSSDYGPPAASVQHRWGWTDAATLGLRATARSGLYNGGPGITLRLGSAGVLSTTVAFSGAAGVRAQALALRYDYQSRRWGVGAALRRDGRGYATVGEFLTMSNLRQETYLYASGRVGGWGHLWLSRSQVLARGAAEVPVPTGFQATLLGDRRSTTLGAARALPGGGGSARLSVARTVDAQGARAELAVAAVFVLDSRSIVAASSRAGGGRHSHAVQWTRSPPQGEGWGHDLSAAYDRTSGRALEGRAATQLNAPAVRLRAEYEARHGAAGMPGTDRGRLAASGGLAWLDGRVHASRPIEGGFALVKVGDLAGVPVRVNGAPAGQTDARGELFVPQLSPWYENQIGIDAGRLPIDYGVPRLQQRVALPERAGIVVDFEARPVKALAARLVRPGPHGVQPLARAIVRLRGAGRDVETATGLQGELYLEGLSPGRYQGEAEAGSGEGDGQARCRFVLEMPDNDEVLVEAGDVRCEPA